MSNESRPSVKLLGSGFVHARWNSNLWVQWPRERRPVLADGFGWITHQHVQEAENAYAAMQIEPSPTNKL